MSSFLSTDSSLFQKLNSFTELVMLNFVFLLCSIPIVTIGASKAALFYAVSRMREGEGSPFKNFFKSFKENLVQGILTWLILLVIGGGLCFCILLYLEMEETFILIVSVVALVLWGMVCAWMYPLMASFYCSFGASFKNAVICALNYLPLSLSMALVNLVPLFMFIFAPQIFMLVLPLWVCLWFSFAAWCNAGLLRVPLGKLEDKVEAQEEAAQNEAEAIEEKTERTEEN